MNTENSLTREIASRVRTVRENAEPRLTQEEVGARLGLSKVGYGHYERGVQPFSVWHLFQLAGILGRPVEYLLGLKTDLRLDEQTLLGAYRRLDGSQQQAWVLVSFLQMCRHWEEAPSAPAAESDLVPVIVARQTPDGRLELVQQGLMQAENVAHLSDYEPVDGRALTPQEWRYVNSLRLLTPAEQAESLQELEARVARARAAAAS